MTRLLIAAVLAAVSLAGVQPAATSVSWTATPYETVLQQSTRPAGAASSVTWDAAQNEFQSYQLLLRKTSKFTVTSVIFSDLTGAGTITSSNLSYQLQQYYDPTGSGTAVPDPLSNDASGAVPANITQSVWVTAYVPKKQTAGTYNGSVTVNATSGNTSFPIALTVYDVVVPDAIDSTYTSGTWSAFFTDYADADGSAIADDINNQYGYTRYSDQWWTLIGNIAREMKSERQNQVHVPIDTLLGGQTRLTGSTYSFDWSVFDRFVQTFLANGSIRSLRGGSLLNAGPGGNSSSVWVIDANRRVALAPVGSVAANRWLNQYIPALKAHLDAKGWTAMWYQSISDEPANPAGFESTVDIYRTYFGSISTTQDAINADQDAYVGSVDIWIPSVQNYTANPGFYADRQALGEQVWSYTCGYCADPGDGWLDRMSTMPHYAAKETSWGNYAAGLTGFFHWGYNAWAETGYTGTGGNEARPGDGYIVYPDPAHNTVRSSVRGLSTRDGLQDYELLRILGAHDPATAHNLAASLVPSFDNFSDDIDLIVRQSKALRVAAAAASGRIRR
jgi:hypothetical protein